MTNTTKIVLADDHALLRRTLRERLDREVDFEVVADVANAEEALDEVKQRHPDVVVLDIDMPGTASFEIARLIKNHYASTQLIFLSAFTHDQYIEQALQVGANAYICKSEPPEAVIQAIRAVAAGSAYYSPEVQSRIVIEPDGLRLADRRQTRMSTLTPREREVLRYIAKGLPKKQIAAHMHVSVSTVEAHTARLMNKLDIHDRVELARFAIREGEAMP